MRSYKRFVFLSAYLGSIDCSFLNKAVDLSTFTVIFFKCSLKSNFGSRNIPRCFCSAVCSTLMLLKYNGGWKFS